ARAVQGGGRTCVALLLEGPAARRFAALQQHRTVHQRLVLAQDERHELPATAVGVNDLVALLQIARHGRLFRRLRLRERKRRARGNRHGECEPGERLHRSTSPNTISSEPRMADTSASMWPLQMKSMAWRCAKPGARILHL